MQVQVYHLPIDWRRAKFYLEHPTSQPSHDGQPPCDMGTTDSYFLPCDAIDDVIGIRNWLHGAALFGRYSLFGCYERITSTFQGIMFVFDHPADLSRFHRYCQESYVP